MIKQTVPTLGAVFFIAEACRAGKKHRMGIDGFYFFADLVKGHIAYTAMTPCSLPEA